MYVFIVNEKYCVREEIFILGKFPFKLFFFLLFFYLQYNYFIRYYELIYNFILGGIYLNSYMYSTMN